MSEADYKKEKEAGLIVEWPRKQDILKSKSIEDLHLTELRSYSIKEPLLSKLKLSEGLGAMKIYNKGKDNVFFKDIDFSEKDLELHCSR